MFRKLASLPVAVGFVTMAMGSLAHAQQEDPPPPALKIGPRSGGGTGDTTGGTRAKPRGGGNTGRREPAPAPNDGGGQQGVQGTTEGGDGGAPPAEGEGDQGIFYTSDTTGDEGSKGGDTGMQHAGQTPSVHVVRRGDTLWDLCYYYFNNPWEWPKVWSYNPTITNPHWIYPGDLVRLFPASAGDVTDVPDPDPEEDPKPTARVATGSGVVALRQVAFLGAEEIKFAGVIVGSTEEREMLTQGDEIFIEYEEGKPPQVKKKYAIYDETKQVKHPENGALVGSYVLLMGEVEIIEVKKDKRARGRITYVTDVIERGMRVGPLRTQFKEVAPRAAEKDVEGVIVAMIDQDKLIGERHIVFIDRGANDGVKLGNVFRIIRRGDQYSTERKPDPNVGDDDRVYPDDTIGRLMVVDVGKTHAVAIIVDSDVEAGVGDHVVMRKPKK